MDWKQALEIVVARTKCERRRVLCADDHPDHEINRRRVVELATGEAPTPAEYPSLFRQAANLAGSMAQVVAAAVQGKPVLVPADVLDARMADCLSCEFHDREKKRCTRCGCGVFKLELAPMQCPLPIPRWGPFDPATSPASQTAGPR